MAGASVIGALRVVLGADTAALDKGLKDSQSKLGAFGVAVTAGMAAVAAGVAAAAVQIAGSIQSTIDSADKLNKMSQSTGMSTEALSKLGYAAELSDVSMESLGKSVGKLSKAIISAANDAASPAGQAFTQMGVAVKDQDGTIRNSADVISDVAGKFATYRDGAAKTALAIQLFGKAGADMIPLLNQGAAGLKESGDELERWGGVIDSKTAQAAERFNDNLRKMDTIKKSLFVTITAKLMPSFEALSVVLLKSREDSQLWNVIGDKMATVMAGIVTVGTTLITTWQQIFATAVNLKAAFGQLTSGDFTGAFETMKKSAADTSVAMTGLKDVVQKLWAPDETDKAMSEMSASVDTFMGHMTGVADKLKKDAPWKAVSEDASNALKSFLDSSAKRAAAMNADAATVGKSTGEQAKMRLEAEAWAIVAAKNITITAGVTKAITDAGNAAAAAALKMQGAQLIDQASMPWDQRAQQVQQYSAAMLAAGASADQLSVMQARITFPSFTSAAIAAADFGMQMDQLATGAVNSLSTNLAALVTGTKSAADAFKAFATSLIADIAAMIVKMLIFKAIRTAIFGFSDGGMVGGTGLSLTGTGGLFADGGFVSGPGTGTSDSIPARLSDGEFVVNAAATKQFAPLLQAINSGNLPSFKDGGDASGRQEQGGGNDLRRGAGSQPINLSMPIAATRDAFRAIIEGINEMTADGYRLNVVPA
ncbi:hypothetical protein JQ600_35495 [Bradyrhizobium sp. AUGA SZCCT0176]|uniref:phage tail tape measure C-terminal domain-containing protein n=1 Tax=Bradyrhizobium sp. AUGA SZCCT0176 TaxID=2807664 RepID=UPI001BA5EB48|nr:phage tail tape measure C-terminal domain-containing protein [Bradyrhizobium sp. AUGA SZCCT0176]MBR1230202.1 hypothetical protein [Bradyrhizobium sp. AUGA SZCCT0176]